MKLQYFTYYAFIFVVRLLMLRHSPFLICYIRNHCSFFKIIFVYLQITALKIKYNPFAKAFLDAKERYVALCQPYTFKTCCHVSKLRCVFLALLSFHRSDHKEIIDDVGDNQQSGYSQCK